MLKIGAMMGPKVAVVYPDTIKEWDLNKPEMRIPIILKKLGMAPVIIAPGSRVGEKTGIPEIILLQDYMINSTLDPARQLKLALQLNKLVKQEKPDVLWFYLDFVAAAIVKMLNPRIKIVYRVDIEEDSFDKMPYPKWMIRFAMWVRAITGFLLITQTQYNYDMTVALAPVTRAKMRILRCGVPENLILKKGEKSGKKKVILCIARIARVKRLEMLIRSFAKLSSKYPGWSIRLVGPVWDEQYFKELKKQVKCLGLVNKVKFLGYISDKRIRNEYLDASIFCLPSDRESPAAVRGEAMGMGVPIVTTATVGSEYVKGKGIVIPIGDEDALTNGLDTYMGSKEAREEAGARELAFAKTISINKVTEYILSELGYKGIVVDI